MHAMMDLYYVLLMENYTIMYVEALYACMHAYILYLDNFQSLLTTPANYRMSLLLIWEPFTCFACKCTIIGIYIYCSHVICQHNVVRITCKKIYQCFRYA